MSDRIILTGMRFFGYHGAIPEENRLGQEFRVDVEMTAHLQAAGQSDDLEKTIDYSKVYTIAKEVAEGPAVKLIETVAERIAGRILESFPVQEVVVRVHKPSAPIPGIFDCVTVEIRRRRAQP